MLVSLPVCRFFSQASQETAEDEIGRLAADKYFPDGDIW
jgi:hypothetical protein